MTISSTAIFSIEFFQYADTIAKATLLLREAIGQIKCLSDSPLGKNPLCADKIDITDKRRHAEIRKVITVEDLVEYEDYLEIIINHLNAIGDGPSPTFINCGRSGFSYTTASGRATISIFVHRDYGWQISGRAFFKNPEIAYNNLSQKGFICLIGQIAV